MRSAAFVSVSARARGAVRADRDPAAASADASACLACKACDANADTTGACTGNGTADVVNCACRQGYSGTGVSCTACFGSTADWLTSFCEGIEQGRVKAAVSSAGAGVDWCSPPASTPCDGSFSAARAAFYAGNASHSLQVAGSPFVPAVISASLSKDIMRAAFRRFRASRADACTVTAEGAVSCKEQVALLAVPGLLIQSYPGSWPCANKMKSVSTHGHVRRRSGTTRPAFAARRRPSIVQARGGSAV
jgi:hypothetical protein